MNVIGAGIRNASAAILFAISSVCLVGPSLAGAPTLPNALVSDNFGFNFAIDAESSTSVGTLNADAMPGCGGSCVATTALGPDPSVALSADEVVYELTAGGSASAYLGYYFEYYVPDGDDTTLHSVAFHVADALDISSTSSGETYLKIGQAGTGFDNLNNFFGPVLANDGDCVNACTINTVLDGQGPFPSVIPLSVAQNTLYLVVIGGQIDPDDLGTQNSLSVDPYLTTTDSAGLLLYSPGVTQYTAVATPEPATWLMLVTGFVGLGFAARRRMAIG